MDEAQLIHIQDHFFEISKQILLSEGRLMPVAFVVTDGSCVDNALEDNTFQIEALDDKDLFKAMPADARAILMVPMLHTDKELLFHLTKLVPQLEEHFKTALQVGRTVFKLTEEQLFTHTLQAALDVMRIGRKDVQSAILRSLCEKVKAFAVIFNSEAYSVDLRKEGQAPVDFSKSLQDDPTSIESLTSQMETSSFKRMVLANIKREKDAPGAPRDSGKVLGFEDRPEMLDREGSEEKLSGRFIDLLQPVN